VADYLSRAEAAQLAGLDRHAWISLQRIADFLPGEEARALAPRALEIAGTLEVGSGSAQTVERLERAAGRQR
jgi:hypothetical protein